MDRNDARLEAMLLEPEPAIRNDGFTETVMTAVRARRRGGAKAGRLTLGGAVLAGSVVTALVAAPLDTAFISWVPGSAYATSALAVLFVACVAIPTVWAFYAE
jgi:hypothetical protein